MKKVVLITGTSSGIGLETALYFREKGWDVVATMRNPTQRKTGLHGKGFDMIHLDVTDIKSIRAAMKHTMEKYGRIDAVVNNAGYGVFGPFENSSINQVKRQFDTNVLGLMDVCREIMPIMRKQKSGTIINISSVAGKMAFPMGSIYNGSKWAVEGFSEAIYFELMPFNVKVKIVEPGSIKTDFSTRSMDKIKSNNTDYEKKVGGMMDRMQDFSKKSSHPRVVAKAIYRAATDDNNKLRYHCGKNAGMIIWLRKLLPERLFLKIMGSIMKK